MGFKLVRVDATEPCKIPLPVGTHLIGRGKFLDCDDPRVSRTHGKLKVMDDVVTITSLHQNPCFFRRKGGPTIQVLSFNTCIDLYNGDQFSLIPDGYWYELIYCIESVVLHPGAVMTPFKRLVKPEGERSHLSGGGSGGDGRQISEARAAAVRHSLTQNSTTAESQGTNTSGQEQNPSPSKRTHPDPQSYNMKKPKTEPSSPANVQYGQNETIAGNNDQNPSGNTQAVSNNDQSLSENGQSGSKIIPKNDHNDDGAFGNSNTDELPNVKPEPNSPENEKPGPSRDQQVDERPAAGGAGDNVAGAGPAAQGAAAQQGNNGRPREKCMYGERCYRVNPVHKAQFSHPGDADWDALRECPRGAHCRDARAAHWRDNAHPPAHHAHPPAHHAPHRHRRQRHNDRPGIRVVQRHGNIFYINAHSVHFYDDHFQVQDSDGESVDYDYEF